MKKVLLVAATTGYQVRSFSSAAQKLGIELILATDRCHVLEDPWGDQAVAIRFDDPQPGIADLKARAPFAGVIAVGDKPSHIASLAAEAYGLRFSPPSAVLATKNKFLSREKFREA